MQRLRIGMPGEFAPRAVTPALDRRGAPAAGFEVVTGEVDTLAQAFRQYGLDVAFLVGAEAEPRLAGAGAPRLAGLLSGPARARSRRTPLRLVSAA